jgi:AcrR family transcriptional regulator
MAKKVRATPDESRAVIDAMLALAAEGGWRAVTLAEIARRSNLSLGDLHRLFETKQAILLAYRDSLDEAMLAGDLPDPASSPRDRLFDVLMRRFDAMQRDREAIDAILHGSRRDPWAWLCAGPGLWKMSTLALEAAGISASGPLGRLKAKAVLAIYLSTARIWLTDDSPDMAKTMASLDRSLRRAEEMALFLCRARPDSRRRSTEAERASA